MPRITTIIPTYRRPKLLRRAIRSVLKQTYQDFQICVYDNASGDETAKVVAELAKEDPRVMYFCRERNIGGLENFNLAMRDVSTTFFNLLSDDDFLLPSFFDTALEGFNKHPESIFSSTLTAHIMEGDDVINIPGVRWPPGFYNPPDGLMAMLDHGHPTWTGILFRREVLEKVGVLLGDVGLTSDLDFELRIAAHFPFVVSLKLCAVFVTHRDGAYRNSKLCDFWPGWRKMISILTEDSNLPVHVRTYANKVLYKSLKRHLFRVCARAALNGNNEDARKALSVILSEYGSGRKVFLFYFIVKVLRYFPFMRLFGLRLKEIRCLLSKKQCLQENVYDRELSIVREMMLSDGI